MTLFSFVSQSLSSSQSGTQKQSICSKLFFVVSFASISVFFARPAQSHDVYESYREHLLLSDQLCPNPVLYDKKSKVATLNTYELDHFSSSDKNACILNRDDGSKTLVRAVSASVEPWNFSGASECNGMIHLNLGRSLQKGSDPRYWCQMDRWKQNVYGGKYFDPQLWLYPKGQFGVYFSTEDWGSTFHLQDREQISNTRPQFIHFAFNTFWRAEGKGSRCSLTVQQYAINHQRHECRSWDMTYQTCGVYGCNQHQGEVLNQMGFSTITSENSTIGNGNNNAIGNETMDYFEDVRYEGQIDDLFRQSQQEKLDKFLAIAEVISLVAAVVAAVNVFLFSFLRFSRPDAHGDLNVTA